jgi:cellulose synthase/poly-beta-1,6-N-acetylglucosamine synthase-like glycosyltransferase
MALFPKPINIEDNLWDRTSVTVLIPAHNEEMIIAKTLRTIVPQLKPTDQLIVIADNCSDRTAEIVTAMGIKVIERHHKELRGKGYAVDFGLTYLTENPPDVVVMVDADCAVEEHTIEIIASLAFQKIKPVQATYLMSKPLDYNFKDQISNFALIIKNQVRPLGLLKLGMPCLLNGSGMAFPWEILDQVSFANSKTVDDMQLGLDFAITGFPPLYCHTGKVIGRLMEGKSAKSQKSRWEHGHIETTLMETPRLLKAAIDQKRLDLLIIALDLLIPPLSLFVSLWLGLTLISLLMTIFNLSYTPFILSAMAGLMIFTAILIAWVKFGKQELSLITLFKIPLYILWKIPIYFNFLFKRQSEWIRTERDS